MSKHFYFISIFITFLYQANLYANNAACVLPSCPSCTGSTLAVSSTYAMPGRGRTANVQTCLPIPNVRAFNQCARSTPPASCRCTTTEWCLSQLNESPGTIDVTFDAPRNCGYRWQGFSMSQYRRDVAQFMSSGDVNCSHSMCTSAVFLALIAHAKKLRASGRISQSTFEELTTPGGRAYRIINEATEPNVLVERYGLGRGYTYDGASEIARTGNRVPKKGDLIQMWRYNGSGHSAIFKGFLDTNGDGRNDLICYWTSQQKTNGYGDRCETISDMETLRVGSFS